MGGGRTLIICASVHHGNTARVARAMADVLGADVASPREVSSATLAGYDLLGCGSGVYYGRLHEDLTAWLRAQPDRAAPRRPAFVFSTSGLPWLSKAWHAPVKRLLQAKGFEVVAEFACRGFDTWGPLWFTGGLNRKHPDDRDLDRARRFAAGLATTWAHVAYRDAAVAVHSGRR